MTQPTSASAALPKRGEDYPPEVWSIILKKLAYNPPPLSNPPSLKQQDLVSASQTCRLFHDLVEPLLYTHIYTDNLPSLLADVRQPWRRRQLALTKSLRIEYCEKGREPSYVSLCEDGDWVWENYGKTKAELQEPDCQAEVYALTSSIDKAGATDGGLAKVFPKLTTIAVGSIKGESNDDWRRFCEYYDAQGLEPPTYICNKVFQLVIAKSNVKHVCYRDTRGPLSPLLLTFQSDESHRAITWDTTVHFPHNVHDLPLTVGTPMRWVSDATPPQNSGLAYAAVCRAKVRLMRERQAAISGYASGYGPGKLDNLDLQIYCSTTWSSEVSEVPPPGQAYRSEAEQRILAEEMGGKFKDDLRRQRGTSSRGQEIKWEDEIVWAPSADTPSCLACGTGPPA